MYRACIKINIEDFRSQGGK